MWIARIRFVIGIIVTIIMGYATIMLIQEGAIEEGEIGYVLLTLMLTVLMALYTYFYWKQLRDN